MEFEKYLIISIILSIVFILIVIKLKLISKDNKFTTNYS